MDMNTEKTISPLIGKKTIIELLKDNKRLTFTGTILNVDDKLITFQDRDNIIYSFNVSLIQQVKVI